MDTVIMEGSTTTGYVRPSLVDPQAYVRTANAALARHPELAIQ